MRNRFLLAALPVVALIAVACGGNAGATAGATTAAATAPATSAAATPGAATSAPATGDAGAATVEIASTDLGDILVDGEGMTLYAFLPDEETGEPTCYEDCATAWPPLVSSGEITVGEGLDDSDFTTVARTDDAGDQVKIGSWPLYYFASDSAPGDVNGQGVGDNWFVVDANGELITE